MGDSVERVRKSLIVVYLHYNWLPKVSFCEKFCVFICCCMQLFRAPRGAPFGNTSLSEYLGPFQGFNC